MSVELYNIFSSCPFKKEQDEIFYLKKNNCASFHITHCKNLMYLERIYNNHDLILRAKSTGGFEVIFFPKNFSQKIINLGHLPLDYEDFLKVL